MPIQINVIPTNLNVGEEYDHPMIPQGKAIDISFIDQASSINTAVTLPVDSLIQMLKDIEERHSPIVTAKPTLLVPGK